MELPAVKLIPSAGQTPLTLKAISAAKRCHEELSLDIGPDARKFANIVNMHGVSLSSTSNDIQIVNLWTCIETLVPSEQTASKISNAVKRVSPILALGYYKRLTITLLTDLLRWDRYCFSAILKKSKIDNSLPLYEKFMQLLREEENDADLRDLLTKCRDFELLRYRITSIVELLRDPEKARARLEQHERLVTWQFYRIYRCRNGIVHAGDSPNHTKYLVESAHDYFDQALNFCVEVSSWKGGFNTFESCFDFATSEYQRYMRNLKSDRAAIVWRIPKQRGRAFIFQDSLK